MEIALNLLKCSNGYKDTVSLTLLRYMWSFEDRIEKPIALLKEKYYSTRFIQIIFDKEAKALLGLK